MSDSSLAAWQAREPEAELVTCGPCRGSAGTTNWTPELRRLWAEHHRYCDEDSDGPE